MDKVCYVNMQWNRLVAGVLSIAESKLLWALIMLMEVSEMEDIEAREQNVRAATIEEGYQLQPGKRFRCPIQGDVTRGEFITCPYRVHRKKAEEPKSGGYITKRYIKEEPEKRESQIMCAIDPNEGFCYAWEDIKMEREVVTNLWPSEKLKEVD